MKLEDGKCAHCGKGIDQSEKFTPHNVEIAQHAVHTYRPIFCSAACVKTAVESFYSENDELRDLNSKFARSISVCDSMIEDCEQEYKNICKKLDADHEAFIKRLAKLTENYSGDFYGDDQRQIDEHAESIRTKKNRAYMSNFDTTNGIRSRHFDEIGKLGKPLHALRQKAIHDAKQQLFLVYENSRAAYEAANAPPPPPEITNELRYEHTHILGASGTGKSTLIQQHILEDLSKPDPPAMIIIDPKGLMVDRIARLQTFYPDDDIGRLNDRLIIIDPLDPVPPPLNVFKPAGNTLVINQAIANFAYIFSQSNSELSSKMRPVFKFCARLMFSVPNADINRIMDFLESKPDDPRFQPYIDAIVDPGAKRFFDRDFHSFIYKDTREHVKIRFNDILSMPEINTMFGSPAPSLDMLACIQQRKIILVKTGFATLGLDASQLLGRYVISLAVSAAYARIGIPRDQWNPAFLYIDEFQDFVDEEETARQFRLAREYNMGIVCALQNMFTNELNDNLRTAISTNTRIKYCAKPESKDESYMLRDIGCDKAFLDKMIPTKTEGKFACLVKGSPAFPITVPFGNITPDMQMSDTSFQEVLENNRQKFRIKAESPKPTLKVQISEPPPHHDPDPMQLPPAPAEVPSRSSVSHTSALPVPPVTPDPPRGRGKKRWPPRV